MVQVTLVFRKQRVGWATEQAFGGTNYPLGSRGLFGAGRPLMGVKTVCEGA